MLEALLYFAIGAGSMYFAKPEVDRVLFDKKETVECVVIDSEAFLFSDPELESLKELDSLYEKTIEDNGDI